MWIFIRDVPPITTNKALGQFLHKKLNRNWVMQAFFESELKQCSILRITDPDTSTIEYHGVAEIESLKPDNMLISQLDGQSFLGKPVCVRKYYHRAICNSQWHHGTTHVATEIKQGNRRRTHIKIEMIPTLRVDSSEANH